MADEVFQQTLQSCRYEFSFFIGPDSEEKAIALSEAIMDLSEFKAVGGGAVGMQKLLCACGTPTVVCTCGDDRCPKCDPEGCPGA